MGGLPPRRSDHFRGAEHGRRKLPQEIAVLYIAALKRQLNQSKKLEDGYGHVAYYG